MWYVVIVKKHVGAEILICGEAEVKESYSRCDYLAFDKYEDAWAAKEFCLRYKHYCSGWYGG